VELSETVYALDSTTIDLCLSLFPWGKFRRRKSAVKLHTLLDLRGSIPTNVYVTGGQVHDVNLLDELFLEAGAFYLFDRGQTGFDVAETFSEGKLGKSHAEKLVQTSEALNLVMAAVALHTSAELVQRQKIHELGKYSSSLVHRPFLSRKRNGGRVLKISNRL
jgi:hypothetical protein